MGYSERLLQSAGTDVGNAALVAVVYGEVPWAAADAAATAAAGA